MGLFDKLFHKAPKNAGLAPALDAWLPVYGQFGTNIYASDAVQQAIACIVRELKKLNPKHIRDKVTVPHSDIQRVLDNPNPLMTTSEFIEKIGWLLMLNYNAFIIPTYKVWTDPSTGEERRKYETLYPIQPTQVNFIEDATGRLFVQFWFLNGTDTTIPYENVIHIKHNFSVNTYMGGNEAGQPDHKALLETLELNKTLLNGIAKAMKASYAVNGIVKYNTLMDDGAMAQNLRELERKLNNNESGFLPIDMKADFMPLEHKSELIDEPTLKFIDEKILRNWGVPLAILTGDYSKETYESFYQSALEHIIKEFSEAFTKKLFTQRERDFSNEIVFYTAELIFMSMSQKIELVNLLAPTGAMFENEKRKVFGLPPLPELEGKRYMSLNWIDADKAAEYQVGKTNVDIVDEEKQEV